MLIEKIKDPSAFYSERIEAFQTRFETVTPEDLQRFDADSEHFSLIHEGNFAGGFRITSLGQKRSEVETLFPAHPFTQPSVELGRFWFAPKLQNSGLGQKILPFLFGSDGFLSQQTVYLKSHLLLGIFMKKFGLIKTNDRVIHPTLNYSCYLYRRYPKIGE